MALRRSRVTLYDAVGAPITGDVRARGAVCRTCLTLVDHEEIVEGLPGASETCKVLVRHHGAEELRTFDLGSRNWDFEDLASMMSRTNWFDPHSHEGAGLGMKSVKADDHDERTYDVPKIMVGGGLR